MRWMVIMAACLMLVGCAPKSAPATGDSAELASLRTELAAREQTIADLQKQVADLRRPAAPSTDGITAGQGDGRFLVMPARVHPGELIAVHTEMAGGTLNLIKKDGMKAIASYPGPVTGRVTTFSLPKELTPGEYYVTFVGRGGTTGEAVITVEQGQ